MRVYVIIAASDQRAIPIRLFYDRDIAISFGENVYEFLIQGSYRRYAPVYASFVFDSDTSTYILDGLFSSQTAAQANAGMYGKVTVLKCEDNHLDQDGWIERE